MLMIKGGISREQQTNWQIGARVLEAIGVAFGKGKRYSEMPTFAKKENEADSELINYIMSTKAKNGKR